MNLNKSSKDKLKVKKLTNEGDMELKNLKIGSVSTTTTNPLTFHNNPMMNYHRYYPGDREIHDFLLENPLHDFLCIKGMHTVCGYIVL